MSCLASCASSYLPRPSVYRNGRVRCSLNGGLPDVPHHFHINRKHFPSDFQFGVGTSAYQTEGGANKGGKGPSIWDTFTHNSPDRITDRSNGDIANDSYELYLEDIKMMKELGVNSYRFSISWSRILPEGNTKDGSINPDGVKYYHKLLDALKANGIEPFVTLFHYDLPQALETKYNGVLSRSFIDDFEDYADVCFKEFGKKVKHWFTMNEPQVYTMLSYDLGRFPASRCSFPVGQCLVGDSAREPYTATHNLILGHATVVKLYRSKYQASQGGQIGITLNCTWIEPYSDSYQDRQASERQMEFEFGWYLDPLVYGDYPFTMRALVRNRLPYFTEEEAKMVKGSYDYIGVNYYSATYGLSKDINANDAPISYTQDSYTETPTAKDGVPIGPSTNAGSYNFPEGLKKVLMLLKDKYQSPVIYITENGLSIKEEPYTFNDFQRVDYLAQHVTKLREAMRDGANVKGYFVWTLMDDFEWVFGFTLNMGLYFVDRESKSLERHRKLSGTWYSHFLRPHHLPIRPPPPTQLDSQVLTPEVESLA